MTVNCVCGEYCGHCVAEGARKPRVYVVQQPATYDRATEKFIPKYDVTPAGQFGELVFLIPPGNIYRNRMASTLATLRAALKDATADDYLLAVGDPVAIATAVLVAGSHTGGKINLLKWDRLHATYESFAVSP